MIADDLGSATVRPHQGGSTTQFAVTLPEGASCPGDSANDGYRVQSYLVPLAVDPTTVAYDGLGPTPQVLGDPLAFQAPLFDIDTSSFVSAQTAEAPAPGAPGAIVNLPVFSFGVFGPGDVPAGSYHLGIACTLDNQVVSAWDAQLTVTEAVDDVPAGIHWEVADAAASGAGSPAATTAIAIGLLITLALLVARRRRPRHPIARSLEES